MILTHCKLFFNCLIKIAFLFFLCISYNASGDQTARVEKPLVVASIRPLALLIKDLAGTGVNIDILVDSAASPHDFSLTIGQALELNEADLLVWNGPEFERFLSKGIRAKDALSLSELIDIDHDKHGGEHNHSKLHAWLRTKNIELLAIAIAARLESLLPLQVADISARLESFLANLKHMQREINEDFLPYRPVPFLVYHDGYGEFVDEFGLNQVAKITSASHERLSAKRLVAVGKKAKGAACLLAESAELEQAQRYARMYDLDLVMVDLLATDSAIGSFADYFQGIAEAFKACITKKNPASALRKLG